MDDPPCNCSNRVSIEYLSEGRYRLGDKTLFIRVSTGKNAHIHTHTQTYTRMHTHAFLCQVAPELVLAHLTLVILAVTGYHSVRTQMYSFPGQFFIFTLF